MLSVLEKRIWTAVRIHAMKLVKNNYGGLLRGTEGQCVDLKYADRDGSAAGAHPAGGGGVHHSQGVWGT
jgi:hypothetical protein